MSGLIQQLLIHERNNEAQRANEVSHASKDATVLMHDPDDGDLESKFALIKDHEDASIRRDLASLGLFHDTYKDDPDTDVRVMVARVSDDNDILEYLKTDNEWTVRRELAKRGLFPRTIVSF